MSDQFSSDISVPASGPERLAAIEQLHDALLRVWASDFAEVWVDHCQYPALCALVNRDRGWLMLLRYEGDAGFSSRGTDDLAQSGGELEFVLSNGQLDVYPIAYTLPTREVLEALELFAASKRVPESIVWYNDSQDGSTGPNDLENK